MKTLTRTRKGNHSIALLLALLAGLITATGVLAQGPAPLGEAAVVGAGSLDPTFGTNGHVITDLGGNTDAGNGVAIQSDGKILLAGSAQLDPDNQFHRTPVVLRYNPNGALDSSFAANGRLVIETTGFFGSSIALQSDGKLLVCGRMGSDFAVARYNANGAPDTQFGTNGIASIHFSDDVRTYCADVAVQPDGKIVLASSEEIGNYIYFVIARFNSNGTPDLGFNDRGFQIVDFDNSRYNNASAVAIQGDGKIVVSGTMWTDLEPGEGPWITLARFTTNGQLDSTFGTGGMVTSRSAKLEAHEDALALQSNGKIVVAGTRFKDDHIEGSTDDLAVARFNSNGSLDSTFGGTGFVTSDFGNNENGHDVAIQQDGKVVVAGKQSLDDVTAFVLARYNSNGSPDTSFGTAGQVVSDFGGSNQSANGMAIRSNGRIVVGGSSNGDAALARYLGASTNFTPVTVGFLSLGDQDGWILESNETSELGGSINKIATTFNVGDNEKDRQYRGLVSFNTASLPDTATITAAELRIKRQGIVGTNPLTTHGVLHLSIRKGAFGSLALQPSDFSAQPSTRSTTDPFSPLTSTWYRAMLTTTNLGFIQKGPGVTQFRIAFSTDDNDDLGADYMKFFSGNASSGSDKPVLYVTYIQ